jgi:threonine/homoserine/homoserine lactone efflux protein
VIPQFLDLDRGHLLLQGLLLGACQIVVAVTVNGLIALTAGTVALFLADRPAWLRAQRLLMGTTLAALALLLLTSAPDGV